MLSNDANFIKKGPILRELCTFKNLKNLMFVPTPHWDSNP
jgi:hypothetical protein